MAGDAGSMIGEKIGAKIGSAVGGTPGEIVGGVIGSLIGQAYEQPINIYGAKIITVVTPVLEQQYKLDGHQKPRHL